MIANAADGKTTMPDDRDAIDALGTVARLDIEHEITHFLHMPTEDAAERVRIALTARDFVVDDVWLIFGTWCVTVRTILVPEESAIVELRRIFTEIAEENDGEYDGWEGRSAHGRTKGRRSSQWRDRLTRLRHNPATIPRMIARTLGAAVVATCSTSLDLAPDSASGRHSLVTTESASTRRPHCRAAITS